MDEIDYLYWLYDLVLSYGASLGGEKDRIFYFRREAGKRRPRIHPQTIEDFIANHDFS